MQYIERKYEELIEMVDAKAYLSRHTPHGLTLEQLLAAFEIVRLRKGSAAPRSEADIYHDEYKIL